MSTEFWIAQSFNGISYGALLFLLASGLSLIFGVMRVVNLAHGSYFMLGGYVGLTVALRTKSFTLACLAAAVAIGLVGMGMERFFLRRLQGQVLGQVLMTIGFALIFQDLALLHLGRRSLHRPDPGAPDRHHPPGWRGVPGLPHLHHGAWPSWWAWPSGWCSTARAWAR